jgi:hypothetical protein
VGVTANKGVAPNTGSAAVIALPSNGTLWTLREPVSVWVVFDELIQNPFSERPITGRAGRVVALRNGHIGPFLCAEPIATEVDHSLLLGPLWRITAPRPKGPSQPD